MMERAEVLVVGGGIIGLITAYFLRKEGAGVLVIAGEDITRGASWNNAGYIAPGYGSPIPSAESIKQLIKWKLSTDTPIKLSTKFILRELLPNGWLINYLKKSRFLNSMEFAKIIRRMSKESACMLDRIITDERLDVEMRKGGVMDVYLSRENLEEHLASLEESKELAIQYSYLDKDNCLSHEPLLSKNISGGILFEEDYWINPSKMLLELTRVLKERYNTTIIHKDISSIGIEDDRISYVDAGRERYRADYYILACGAYTKDIMAKIGLTIPLAAGFGYAIKTRPSSKRMKKAVVCGDYRIATSQTLDGNLRATGFFELAHLGFKPREERYRYLREKASKYIPLFSEVDIVEKWMGPRPCIPDGLPAVGRIRKYENLLISVGHCRLGLTLSAITAKMIDDLINDRDNEFLDLVSPSRIGL